MMVKCMDEQRVAGGPSFSKAELLWHCLSLKTFRIRVELFCLTVLYENGLNLKNFGIRAELRVSLVTHEACLLLRKIRATAFQSFSTPAQATASS